MKKVPNDESIFEKEDAFCPCGCGMLDAGVSDFGLCVNKNDLSLLGSGVPLYYQFKAYLSLVMLIPFLIAGIYSTYDNFSAARGYQW